MTFEETVKQLQEKVARRGINYSLDALAGAFDRCGNPQENMPPVIHIAGTNGKGSTANFCTQILEHAGYNVGLFTSPHLSSYCERIQRNRTPISERSFTYYFEKANAADPKNHLSEFEILSLMAALYYKDQFALEKIDICVVEVGLGGKLDTTNLLHTNVSVITQIHMDHADILGDTIAQIATDKAGIIRPNTPILTTTAQYPEALDAIETNATAQRAQLTILTPIPETKLPSHWPAYQGQNLALAIEACNALIPNIATPPTYSLPFGRFTQYQQGDQTLIIDGAHNPNAIEELATTIRNQNLSQDLAIIFSILKTKDTAQMVQALSTLTRHLYYCDFAPGLSNDLATIKALLATKSEPASITEWSFTSPLPSNKTVLFTGSLHFIGELKSKLNI